MTGNVIVKPSVRQRFDSFMERGRVLFFSAPCGSGKSTLSDALLSGRDVLRILPFPPFRMGGISCLLTFFR